ncbi:MAG: TetR/AcrR family transcriptional regulator C-terminal domain-containing protein [Lachnospiraceae bacterium]
MKNEEISLYTKKTFSESLKKAMKKKPFQKITVSDLVRDCNVNRKTFYYHFEDIYALLKWTFEQEAIEVVKHFDLVEDYEEAINFVMDYVEENDYILNCACDSIGRDELKRFFYADFLDIIVSFIDGTEQATGKTLDPGYKDFLSYFYMESLAGMLLDWIREKDKRARHTIVRYICSTMQDSLMGILDRQTYAS